MLLQFDIRISNRILHVRISAHPHYTFGHLPLLVSKSDRGRSVIQTWTTP